MPIFCVYFKTSDLKQKSEETDMFYFSLFT